ncbi:MAG: hypothetical protein ACRECY_17795 [Phyllobacterium sp.]
MISVESYFRLLWLDERAGMSGSKRFHMAVHYSREVLTEPIALLSALQNLFPDFVDEELVQDIHSGDAGLHTVIRAFASSFDASTARPSQLAGLARLIGHCVAFPDRLENAVGTCFLEHLHQIDGQGVLWKFLSPDVVAYMRRRN